MSALLNPTRNAAVNSSRNRHGYVARLVELPSANARTFGVVVFCGEDKRFYECVRIQTATEDYYKWIAVTSGAQRSYFIPVEKLTEEELPPDVKPSKRNNSFDAIVSAINEIAVGLYRYNVRVDPLCYRTCTDKKYKAGKKYYVWYDSYDRAEYVKTTDTTPVVDKAYFVLYNGTYETVIFEEGQSFEPDTTYYESSRPLFIPDEKYKEGEYIDHWVFESNGVQFSKLTEVELCEKTNEIIDEINVTNARLSKIETTASLFELAKTINLIIDEINPFSNTFNNILNRLAIVEAAALGEQTIELPVTLKKGKLKYKVDIYDDSHGIGFDITRC